MACPEIQAGITRMMKIFLLTIWKNSFGCIQAQWSHHRFIPKYLTVFIYWNLFIPASAYVYVYLKTRF